MTGRVTTRTNSPERLEDQLRELLLYDPQDLANAFLIDDLPGTVAIDEAGQPAPGRPAPISSCLRSHFWSTAGACMENWIA